MSLKLIFLKQFLGPITTVIFLFFVVGCSKPELPNGINAICSSASASNNNRCSYTTEFGELYLYSSLPSMPFETPITLTLELPNDVTVVSSEIRGLSMYMGRIPVVWQQQANNDWLANILLGACTDPHMIWQLHLNLQQHSSTSQVLIPFQSNWN